MLKVSIVIFPITVCTTYHTPDYVDYSNILPVPSGVKKIRFEVRAGSDALVMLSKDETLVDNIYEIGR